MTFLGESIADEPSVPGYRSNKDLMEETMYERNKDFFTELDLVLFDTTSIYFEGRGSEFFGNGGGQRSSARSSSDDGCATDLASVNFVL